MNKTLYIVCLCLLSVLIFYEVEHNGDSKEGVYIPTSGLAGRVKKENDEEQSRRSASGNAAGAEDKSQRDSTKVEKMAYLTFDDGPSANTESVLDTLREKKAVATFFLTGSEITPEREEIVRRAVKQGNAVGVHTYSHQKDKLYRDRDSFFEDYKKASEVIRRITGEEPKLHRFPWGSNNRYVSFYVDELHEKLKAMGVRSFDWNVSGEDSVGGTVAQDTIFENVKKDLGKYTDPIILLHDSATMKNTAAVLGRIIDHIRDEGYEFDTLEKHDGYLFPKSWR